MWHCFIEVDFYARSLFAVVYFLYTLIAWWSGISGLLTLFIGLRNEMVRATAKSEYEPSDPNGMKIPPIRPITKLIGLSSFGLAVWASWWVMFLR